MAASSSAVAESETTKDAEQCQLAVPSVIRFAYSNFSAKGSKWLATCTKCHKVLTENRGVTSAFTK
jgi:hypothetical protein